MPGTRPDRSRVDVRRAWLRAWWLIIYRQCLYGQWGIWLAISAESAAFRSGIIMNGARVAFPQHTRYISWRHFSRRAVISTPGLRRSYFDIFSHRGRVLWHIVSHRQWVDAFHALALHDIIDNNDELAIHTLSQKCRIFRRRLCYSRWSGYICDIMKEGTVTAKFVVFATDEDK